MRFSVPEREVKLYQDGLAGDKFGRQELGRKLSEIFEKIEDPLVVALDGDWGTGKSYFLTRWVGAHSEENNGSASTLYFDAFAHDYLSDPLIALVAALTARLPGGAGTLHKLKRAAMKLTKPAVRIGLAVASAGATEVLGVLGDAAVDVSKNEAEQAFESLWQKELGRSAAMAEFKSCLKELTTSEDSSANPIIIVIDELDRCRPDYALELLEVIKHFFSVPHVHFLLGVNMSALENSVKARYGSGAEASVYLRKFISFTVSLPSSTEDHRRAPLVAEYAKHLGKLMSIPNHLTGDLAEHLRAISRAQKISFRDVNKMMSRLALLPSDVNYSRVFPAWKIIMFTLLIFREINPAAYQSLVSKSASDADVRAWLSVTDDSILQETLDGEYNKNYSRITVFSYSVWMHLLSNGKWDRPSALPDVSKMFDHFPSPDGLDEVLPTIDQKWLSAFNLS